MHGDDSNTPPSRVGKNRRGIVMAVGLIQISSSGFVSFPTSYVMLLLKIGTELTAAALQGLGGGPAVRTLRPREKSERLAIPVPKSPVGARSG
jgi:hypothetical protein